MFTVAKRRPCPDPEGLAGIAAGAVARRRGRPARNGRGGSHHETPQGHIDTAGAISASFG